MANSILQWYRQTNPNDPASDEEIILDYGTRYPLEQLPADFQADFKKAKQAYDVAGSSVGGEISKGFSRGMLGLKSSGAGALALVSDYLGLEGPKQYFLETYKDTASQMAQEAAPSVAKIEGAGQGLGAATQYVAGKAGELIPALGEAGVFALAGTMAAPGPGTEAGAAGGFFARNALRAVLKKTVEKAATPAIRKELEEYAAGKIEGKMLSEATQSIVKDASRYAASMTASAANFATLGAGGAYGELSGAPGVDDATARKAALIAGAGSSVGALIPGRILEGLFPGLSEGAARSQLDKWAVKVPKELLIAGSGMGAMEFFNIAAEKYAKKEEEFTKEDYSRILNAVAVGFMAGGPAAAIAAIRKAGTTEPPKAESPEAEPPAKAPEPTPGEPPKPISPAEVADTYGQVTADQHRVLDEIARKDLKNETTDADKTYLDTLPAGVKARYETIKSEVANAETEKQKASSLLTVGRVTAVGEPEVKAETGTAQRGSEGGQEQEKGAAHGELEIDLQRRPFGKKTVPTRQEALDNSGQFFASNPIGSLVRYRWPEGGEATGRVMGYAYNGTGSLKLDIFGGDYLIFARESDIVKSPFVEAVQELTHEAKALLKAQGITPESLDAGLRQALEPTKEATAVDVARAKARELAMRQAEKPEPKKPSIPASTPESEVKAPGVPGQRDWLANVPESYTAWRTIPKGKEKETLYRDIGRDPDNKNRTKALGVFETPGGKIAVASVYDNRGQKVFLGGETGQSIDSALSKGYNPIETIRTSATQEKFYREYTPEEWAGLRQELEAKASKARSEVQPVMSEEAAGTKTTATGTYSPEGRKVVEKPVQPIISEKPRGEITKEDVNRIHDLVIKKYGMPTPESAKDNLSDALLGDVAFQKRLADIGRDRSYELLSDLLDIYEDTIRDFAERGRTDPEELRSALVRRLEGLTAEKPKTSQEAGGDVPEDVRYSKPVADATREREKPELSTVGSTVLKRLNDLGLPVRVLQTKGGALLNELSQSMGSYDRATKAINWVLSDLSAPTTEDIRVLFEEVGHALFDSQGKEVTDQVLRAIGSLEKVSPAEFERINRDIANAYPEGVRPDIYQEEKLMGWMSQKLVNEGFNPAASRSIAQNVLRVLKDIYLKAAMWLQKTLLGPEYDNPATALAYFQNRLESFMAGDKTLGSWVDRIGARKPAFDRELSWQQPAGIEKELVQTFNTVTGQIDTATLIEDSVEAAILNGRGDQMRFSIPAPGAPMEPYVDPSQKLNRAVGVNNKVRETRDRIGLVSNITAEQYRKLNGLSSTEKIAAIKQLQADEYGAEDFRPNQKLEDFSNEQNVIPAHVDAIQRLTMEMAAVGKNLERDKTSLIKHEEILAKTLGLVDKELDNYRDAQFMGDTIQKGVKSLLREDIRREIQASRTLGIILQVTKQLDAKIGEPIDPAVVNALRKLYTGDQLTGTYLFDLLDFMAKDPAIDFTRPATEIRNQIKTWAQNVPDLTPYQTIVQNTPEGKALMATVIAYGKTHQRIMAELEMRRMASGEARAELEGQLKNLHKETTEQITTGIKRIAKTAKLEERARGRYRELLGRAMTAKRNKEHLETRISINEKAIPVYQETIDKLDPKIQKAADLQFFDGMTVRLPKTLDVRPEWEDKTINLNITNGPITDLVPMAEKLAAWVRVREEAARKGDEAALSYDYQTAKQQLSLIVRNRIYQQALSNLDGTTTGIFLSAAPKALESLGTPSSQTAARSITKYGSMVQVMRNDADRQFGYRNPRLEQKLINILSGPQSWWKAKKVSPQWFDRNILSAALGFMEKQQFTEGGNHAAELLEGYAKLGQWLLSQKHIKPVIQGKMREFMPALRDYMESLYESGQYWNGKNEEAGMLVKEPKLSGKLRKAAEVGMRTFQRKFSGSFSNMIHALRGSGWKQADADFAKIEELYNTDRAALDKLLAKYINNSTYGDTVQNDYLYKLFHVPDETAFDSPPLDEAGTTIPVEPMIAARAWDETGGNLVRTIERMFDYQNGEGTKGAYVQKIMLNLLDQFQEADRALEKVEPSSPANVQTLVGLIPDAMIDARRFPHWPGEWFEYHKFDRNDNARMAERISGQINFGRETRTLANLVETAQEEANTYNAKLESVKVAAERYVPSGKRSEIKAAMEKILATDKTPELQRFKTGKERLQFLQRVNERSKFLGQFVKEMSDYYRRGMDQNGSLKWGIRFAQALSGLLVNNPASAISQLATMFDITAQWGASPTMLKATAKTVKFTVKDIAGGLAQAVGWEMMKLSPEEADFIRLGLNDPEVARRYGDIMAIQEGEQQNPWSRRYRIAKEIQSATINRLGEQAKYTPTRPFAPFYQTVFNTNRALTVVGWQIAKGYVAKGLDFIRSHPGRGDITAEDLGLRGLEKDSFDRWKKDVELYGLKYEDMVSGAKDRLGAGDKTVLTDSEMGKLYSLGLNRISLEPNIATMPLWAFNNNLVRFVLPLLGWSYRRALQVSEKVGGLGPQEKRALKYVGTGMLGLAATGLGGLGLSLVVDAYQEDVVGKKRNIRSLRFPTTGQDIIAIQERMARIGTLGLWGELINGAVNVGTGQGDNRMISVDQRVVALQSFQGIQRAISAFYNQDFDPDYQHVVRPLIAAFGGNGMLQYLQIANRAFGLDNAEARTVTRINAENYLRVVGRDLGLSIRTGGGGYNTPTPITPWISRMEYAAYANDPEDFRAAYRSAIEEATQSGKPNPADYVKRAFETRHPLRFVFSATPSEQDYRMILANLDDRGQESVQDAIRLFNYYGGHLGITPFAGSRKKDVQRATTFNPAARARAMALAY